MKTLKQIIVEAKKKQPILISPNEYKDNKHLYRQAGLYEIDRKQVYHIDVPKGHYWHKRPLVRKDEKAKGP